MGSPIRAPAAPAGGGAWPVVAAAALSAGNMSVPTGGAVCPAADGCWAGETAAATCESRPRQLRHTSHAPPSKNASTTTAARPSTSPVRPGLGAATVAAGAAGAGAAGFTVAVAGRASPVE